jgi:hypothetical protein
VVGLGVGERGLNSHNVRTDLPTTSRLDYDGLCRFQCIILDLPRVASALLRIDVLRRFADEFRQRLGLN